MARHLVTALVAAAACLGAVFLIDAGRSPPARTPKAPAPEPATPEPAAPAQPATRPRFAVRSAALATEPPAARESTGAWGTLQSFEVLIAAPDSLLALFPVPSATTTWTFVGLGPEEVAAVIDQPGLPDAIRDELLSRNGWIVADGTVQVVPSPTAVRALPPDARAAIYNVLARWEENEFQHSPYYVAHDDVREWLGGSGLREDLIDIVARTAYPVGEATCFSDLPLAVSLTTSHAEARSLLKALSRTETSILRLRLDQTADVDKIRCYWSGGSANAKDFLPLLESVAENPDINHLDIVHILPPTARRLIYTFPRPSQAIGGRYPDCHWTSLNFFADRPEPRLADAVGATMFAVENYKPGEPPYMYGDVLFMTDAEGNAIHSCVFLAAGYVFTKNGANVLSPWLIMQLDDVLDRYSRLGPVEIKIYRRTDLLP